MEEYLIELKNLSSHLVGRILLSTHEGLYELEVDIIQKESGKIFNHVIILYKQDDKNDALNLAIHHLQKFLNSKVQ